MKKYIKDGQIKFRNQIVLHGTRTIKGKDGKEKEVRTQIINPKEEMLLADGWVEYITPVYEPTIDDYRKRKKDEILSYDSSEEVNAFYMQGERMWLDKATRAGLMLRLQSEVAAGRESTTLWCDGKHYKLPLSTAMQMLYAIELYASQCYDVTQAHLAAVNALQTIDEVNNYNYKANYPPQLEF